MCAASQIQIHSNIYVLKMKTTTGCPCILTLCRKRFCKELGEHMRYGIDPFGKVGLQTQQTAASEIPAAPTILLALPPPPPVQTGMPCFRWLRGATSALIGKPPASHCRRLAFPKERFGITVSCEFNGVRGRQKSPMSQSHWDIRLLATWIKVLA